MPPAGRSARWRAPLTLATVGLLAACGAGPEPAPPTGIDELQIPTESPDPTDFVAEIDNPYLPLVPGSRWVYESQGADPETVTVTVTDETRVVAGVTTTVVSDVVTDADGKVVEETLDWFAQDTDGNVWYFGEDVTNFDNGQPSDSGGSWEAGVDGALPGIVMPAEPTVGHAYRQEFYPGEAEDLGEILAIDGTLTVPAGSFQQVVTTRDWNPLEPDVVEEKQYAPGVGLIAEQAVEGADDRSQLTEFTPG
jgi:hypothetical protein